MSLFYRKLYYILESLKEFFHAEGNGLSEEDLDTEQYKVCEFRMVGTRGDSYNVHTGDNSGSFLYWD